MDPEARARAAMAHLRDARRMLSDAYQYAAMDVGERHQSGEILGYEPPRRVHVVEVTQSWNLAMSEFERACGQVESEIDSKLRLADIATMFGIISDEHADWDRAASTVHSFGLHIHEMYEEVRRLDDALADEPPLPDDGADDLVLASPLVLALRHRPVETIAIIGLVVVMVVGIGRMVLF